jgi:hypothetical protein
MTSKDNSAPIVYLNGLGLGSIAAAMYLIQKADFNPLSRTATGTLSAEALMPPRS